MRGVDTLVGKVGRRAGAICRPKTLLDKTRARDLA